MSGILWGLGYVLVIYLAVAFINGANFFKDEEDEDDNFNAGMYV